MSLFDRIKKSVAPAVVAPPKPKLAPQPAPRKRLDVDELSRGAGAALRRQAASKLLSGAATLGSGFAPTAARGVHLRFNVPLMR